MIKHYRGNIHSEWYPKKASTAFSAYSLVEPDGAGAVQPCTSATTAITGILNAAVASSANNNLIEVLVPDDSTEFIVDGTGFSAADIGTDVDLTDALNVDGAASLTDVFHVTEVISATQAVGKFKRVA